MKIKVITMNQRLKIWLPALLATSAAISILFYLNSKTRDSKPAPVYSYKITNTYPHDPNAFTQGLAFEDGFLYEGTGRQGHSQLRKVKLETGQILQSHKLPSQFFGEGITIYRDKIIQLTWHSKVGFVYDRQSFKLIKTFDYPTQGWGITNDGKNLITSDGTSRLFFLDPETFEQVHQIEALYNNRPLIGLNELEYVKGRIYANIWGTDRIAQIDPKTGKVTAWIDLAGLLTPQDRTGRLVDVLNGIAYDKLNDRLFVTGKLWPRLFEIELVPSN